MYVININELCTMRYKFVNKSLNIMKSSHIQICVIKLIYYNIFLRKEESNTVKLRYKAPGSNSILLISLEFQFPLTLKFSM